MSAPTPDGAGLQKAFAELADDFDSNVDWSNGRNNYGDNEAWISAARQVRDLLAAHPSPPPEAETVALSEAERESLATDLGWLSDADNLFEWHRCASCRTEGPCACSGTPWLTAPAAEAVERIIAARLAERDAGLNLVDLLTTHAYIDRTHGAPVCSCGRWTGTGIASAATWRRSWVEHVDAYASAEVLASPDPIVGPACSHEDIVARTTNPAYRQGLLDAALLCRSEDQGTPSCPAGMAAVYLERLANGETP